MLIALCPGCAPVNELWLFDREQGRAYVSRTGLDFEVVSNIQTLNMISKNARIKVFDFRLTLCDQIQSLNI